VCVLWNVGQPKRKNNKKNGAWGRPKEKTIRKKKCGAAQRENNRKMDRACASVECEPGQREKQSERGSVGQPKGKSIGNWCMCV